MRPPGWKGGSPSWRDLARQCLYRTCGHASQFEKPFFSSTRYTSLRDQTAAIVKKQKQNSLFPRPQQCRLYAATVRRRQTKKKRKKIRSWKDPGSCTVSRSAQRVHHGSGTPFIIPFFFLLNKQAENGRLDCRLEITAG